MMNTRKLLCALSNHKIDTISKVRHRLCAQLLYTTLREVWFISHEVVIESVW